MGFSFRARVLLARAARLIRSGRFALPGVALALLVGTGSPPHPRPAATAPAAQGLEVLLERYPADSLIAPLRRYETEHGRDPQGGQAALLLGRLHFARGEYAQAAAAYLRASARLDPTEKPEARYWAGLSWLALKQPEQARAALEEVAGSSSRRSAEARLGVAQAWELAGQPDRAFDELSRLLQQDPGEAGPAALERLSVLGDRLHRTDEAERARARLVRNYPRSIEAARAVSPTPIAPRPVVGRTIMVQIGAFSSATRARSILNAARQAGWKNADVLTRGEGKARLYLVRLGSFATLSTARAEGERAAQKLGITYKLVGVE